MLLFEKIIFAPSLLSKQGIKHVFHSITIPSIASGCLKNMNTYVAYSHLLGQIMKSYIDRESHSG